MSSVSNPTGCPAAPCTGHRADRALPQQLRPLLHQPAGQRQGGAGAGNDDSASQGILTQAADLGCLQVRFTGGEPLIRPDFEELYLQPRRLGMKVLIFTSARPLTAHWPTSSPVFPRW